MQLKDCIHYYIGAKAKRFPEGAIVDITLWQLEQFQIGHCELIPILRRLENNTEDDLIQLWAIIGGRPDLFYIGGVDLLKGLKYGDWDDSGLFLDLYTLTQMINKMRSLGYDCDGLIDSKQAIDAETLKKEP